MNRKRIHFFSTLLLLCLLFWSLPVYASSTDSGTSENPTCFNHDYDDGKVIRAATASQPGIWQYTCLNCNYGLQKKIGCIKAADTLSLYASETAQTYHLAVTYNGEGTLDYFVSDTERKVKIDQKGNITIPAKYTGTFFVILSVEETDQYYTFDKTVTIHVLKTPPQITVPKIQKTASSTSAQTFQLEAKYKGSGKVTYTSFHPKVTVGKTGKITVAKNFVGTAYLTIHVAETDYYAEAIKKFAIYIAPEQTSLTRLQNLKGKKLKITWQTKSSATGYEIQYATSSNFKNAKTIAKKGYKSSSVTISNLAKKKTYYVRIRIVRRTAGANVFSPWSKAKTIKITK